MPASFGVGLKTVQNKSEPRLFVAYGREGRLREKLLSELLSRTECEVHEVAGSGDVWTELFRPAYRESKVKLTVLHESDKVESWVPLKQWLDKCKPHRLVMQTPNDKLALKLADQAKTRGMVVDCSYVPAKAVESWFKQEYGLTQVQTHSALTYCQNNVSAAAGLLNKHALFGLKFSKETANHFGLPEVVDKKFSEALLNNKKVDAFNLARQAHVESLPRILSYLENKLDELARLHSALTGMKTVSEVALEAGVSRSVVKSRSALAKKYDAKAIMRATLALANADRAWHQGYRTGVMEVLVSSW